MLKIIAAAAFALAAVTSRGDSALLEGRWKVTKYEITVAAAPDTVVDLTDESRIEYTFEDGTYHLVCTPSCLGQFKNAFGDYTLDEQERTLLFVTRGASYEPEFEDLLEDAIGAAVTAIYEFVTPDRVYWQGTDEDGNGHVVEKDRLEPVTQ